MTEAVVSFVVGKLGELLVQEAIFLYGVRDQIEWIERELRRMQSFLKDASSKQKGDERIKNWVKEVREIAYDAEDIIDALVLKIMRPKRRGIMGFIQRRSSVIKDLLARRKVGKEIESIKLKIHEISESRSNYGIENIGSGEGTTSLSGSLRERRRSSPHMEELNIVGFEVDAKALVERLIKGEARRCVISIVGMGGIGKTTLAKKIYNSEDVKRHFDCCAWVYVSQKYRSKDLLAEIGKKLVGLGKVDTKNMNKEDLETKVFEFLSGRRYLIVMDDVWKAEVWDKMNAAFPDEMNASRIMFTTRITDVALHADSRSSPYQLRLLRSDETWELFFKNVYPPKIFETSCPPELEELGKQIVEKCDGLPLAIVVLGGLLSRRPKNPHEWLKVLESVEWHLTQETQTCSDILTLSYNDLHYDLKSCFLYCGLFPKDFEIKAGKLIRLWVAEGFIQERNEATMEDVAEDYLEELIDRSLIQVIRRNSRGGVKACRIHDLLRDLAVSEAKEENFLDIYGDVDFSFPTRSRRLTIHSGVDRYVSLNHSAPQLRSLFCFNIDDEILRVDGCEYLSGGLRFLRVLDLEGIGMSNLPDVIGKLIHLRYLGLRDTYLNSLPNSVCNLFNLQTLDIRSSYNLRIPNEIWELQQLRHLFLNSYSQIEPPTTDYRLDLRNLQTLFTIRADSWIEEQLGTLTNLRKLGIQGNLSVHQKESLYDSILKLARLRSLKLKVNSIPPLMSFSHHRHLHKLYLYGRLEKLPAHHEFPPNLTKLCLESSRLDQDPMPTLKKLQNLQFLKLFGGSYLGKLVDCSAGGFPQLQVLKFKNLGGLEEWRVEEGAMPSLRRLVISECMGLKTLPVGLQHVTTLVELCLIGMPEEFKAKILENKGEDLYKIRHIASITIR